MTRLRNLGAALLLFGLFVGTVAAGGSEQPRAAAPRRPDPLQLKALHAEPDPVNGGRIVDSSGREVLLRGVNVNALVEYWKGTEFPTTFPLTPADADHIASIGWNNVRLLISWSRVEPRPGKYDEAYLKQVDAAVKLLASRGIYSIIDLHQDAWGPTLAAPDGQVCPPGQTPALGWDGAPGWATLDNDGARCAISNVRELSSAVLNSFDAFWNNKPGPGGVGIRTRYVRMLGMLAGRYAKSKSVAGYDVMNEPNAFSAEAQVLMSEFYSLSLRAIRYAEREHDGFSHMFFFEPYALWSTTGSGAPPDFKRDENVVYAPHIYSGGFTGGPITRDKFQIALDEARLFGGAPVLTGEWGAGPERAGPDGDTYFLDHQAFQDEFQFGATLWTWRESCGDPHKAGSIRAGEVPSVWGEFEVDCRTNTIVGPREDLIDQLTRAYPRAVPGNLTSTKYDPTTRKFTAAGTSAPRKGELVAFHPAKLTRKSIKVTGLRKVRLLPAPGGGTYISAQSAGGSWTLAAG